MKKWMQVVAGIALAGVLSSTASAQVLRQRNNGGGSGGAGELNGDYTVLYPLESPDDDTPKKGTVEQGGLLVVVVPDVGSQQPTDIKVDSGRAFQRLGRVWGTQTLDGGNPVGGGGKTLYLFKPLNLGKHKITATYKSARGGEQHEDVYEIEVVKPEGEGQGKAE